MTTPSTAAVLDRVRSDDAFASEIEDVVLHFAAAKPEYAASTATIDRITASMIEIHVSRAPPSSTGSRWW